MSKLTSSSTWRELEQHKDRLSKISLSKLFNNDLGLARVNDFVLPLADLTVDFSKNLIDRQVLTSLIQLANDSDLVSKISAMFNGEKINFTEDRAVLHTALRDSSSRPIMVDGVDIKPQIRAVLQRMTDLANQIRRGQLIGSTGRAIKNIINIGIGGSDLGPASAYLALKDYTDQSLTVRFVSNIDYSDLATALHNLDPAETLFIISSKTFTTDETMTNAQSAKNWLISELGEFTSDKHFIAVSSNIAAAQEFGINQANVFELWDWVGGRYSLCSAIGLSLMIAIGPDNFNAMLDGFYKVDQHFLNTPLETNVPVLLALIDIWYGNFWQAQTSAIIPYSHDLARLPAYLQQAVMESNGKSVDKTGEVVDYQTSMIVWGEPGTNAQHAFFQLIHQGTEMIPVDFIGFLRSHHKNDILHHNKLLANMIAQAEALAFGEQQDINNQDDVLSESKVFVGNKPSNIILGSQLTPGVFGQLIALYEHKIFVQGVIWQINSFDQFGVELGKKLAKGVYQEIDQKKITIAHDASTVNLIKKIISSNS